MAKRSGLRTIFDGSGKLRARAHGVDEIVDVQLSQPIVAHCVESVTLGRGLELFDQLVLEIVDDVAVSIDDDAAVGAEYCRAARASVEIQSVAALPLPDDALTSVEYERRFLSVGRLAQSRPIPRSVSPASPSDRCPSATTRRIGGSSSSVPQSNRIAGTTPKCL